MFLPLAAVAVYRYRLPLTSPVVLARSTLHFREGLLLRLQMPDGSRRWGEVSPLPGFSDDCLDDAEQYLLKCCNHWSRGGGVYAAPLANGLISAGLDGPVSVQCAVDFALSNISVTAATAPDSAGVCPLLSGQDEHLLASMRRHQQRHPAVVKLKVGNGCVVKDICRLQQVVDFFGEGVRFRLDANRQWHLQQAVAFAEGIQEADINPEWIDWIEEPVADACQLRAFYQSTHIHYALDESLREHGTLATGEPMNCSPGLKAIVIKPTMTGSLSRIISWTEMAQRAGIAVVMSSGFESPLMLNQIFHLSHTLGCLNPPGLDTASALGAGIVVSDDGEPRVEYIRHVSDSDISCECILSRFIL